MRRIIVLRCDSPPLAVRAGVRLLRTLNPAVRICGLVSAPRSVASSALGLAGKAALGLDSVYALRPGGRSKGDDGDVALAAWYRDVGHRMAFDVAHLIESDLLLLDSLERLYAAVPPDAVGLTALAPLSEVEHDCEWLRRTDGRRQWERLLSYARAEWAYKGAPQACWRVGACYPRSFLERYAALAPPPLCDDQLRVPLFAQILGFPLADTGFRDGWRDPEADRFFNRGGREIETSAIGAELAKADGRRAFYPVRETFRGWG
jgi:hypothetical protein